MTPSIWTTRIQPIAGSHDGSNSTIHMPPGDEADAREDSCGEVIHAIGN